MEILDAVRCDDQPAVTIPVDAAFVISVLSAEPRYAAERRRVERHPCSLPAALELLGEPIPTRWQVYTRDANQWGVGLVMQQPIPVARDATLHIALHGEAMTLRGCILRCREVLPGWYEGAVLFYDEEPRLAAPPTQPA